ncbi:MAG: thiamine phosphate synthase [Gammaproteobacteria bacterium]|nr:thiamine phosphate synthase [Gammaproteobacteria bacterium]
MQQLCLHVITDEILQSRFTHQDLTRLCSEGGADFIQFREKRAMSLQQRFAVAGAMHALCESTQTCKLIINDDVNLARTIDAYGVHLGSHDMDIKSARKILGKQMVIGRTINTLEELDSQKDVSANYFGVGPVFGTKSKTNAASTLGLATLRRIVQNSPIPIIAIGGIQLDNLEKVLDTGVTGVAVLSNIVLAKDPAEKTAQFKQILSSRGP